MNKRINSINGYSCVQAQVKMQLNFQNVINARVMCLRTHFIPPPPPHPKILYETLPALANIGNFELYFPNFCVLIVKKNLQFKGPFLNIDSHCVMHCVVHRCSAYMRVGVAMPFFQLSFFYNTYSQCMY